MADREFLGRPDIHEDRVNGRGRGGGAAALLASLVSDRVTRCDCGAGTQPQPRRRPRRPRGESPNLQATEPNENVLFTKWGEKSYQRHKIESILQLLPDNL